MSFCCYRATEFLFLRQKLFFSLAIFFSVTDFFRVNVFNCDITFFSVTDFCDRHFVLGQNFLFLLQKFIYMTESGLCDKNLFLWQKLIFVTKNVFLRQKIISVTKICFSNRNMFLSTTTKIDFNEWIQGKSLVTNGSFCSFIFMKEYNPHNNLQLSD